MDRIRKRFCIYGAVQGVGFRYCARHAAADVGATGWARNEYDGSVTMELQGTPEQIEYVLYALDRWRYLHIERMETKAIPPVENERGFRTE